MGFLNKDKLIFDPADMADSDQVGAYLIGADGTVIGNNGTSIYTEVTNTVAVSATNLDIRDLVFATDKVDVTGSDVTVSNTVTVQATNLDIRDLSSAQDSVEIKTAAGQALAIDGSGYLTVNQGGTWNVNLTDDSVADDDVDTGNPFKVGGVAYASALSAVSAAGDRVNMAMDLYRRTRVFMGAQVGINNPAVVAVGTSAAALPASPLAGRQKVWIQNQGNDSIFIGGSDVTTAKGIEVAKKATAELEVGEIPLYAIAASGTHNVRILELA